jgi:hypothetical protein
MKPNAKPYLLIALCLTVLSSFRPNAVAREAGRPGVIVHVYNNAEVPQPVLAEAGAYVRDIFDKVGVELLWLDFRSRLQGVDNESLEHQWSVDINLHLSIVIAPKPLLGMPSNTRNPQVMGVTPLGGLRHTRSYIFYDRVKDFVDRNRRKISFLGIPRLLAYTVAHEMGHLLISNEDYHSSSGIMRAQLNPEGLEKVLWGRLLFTDQEGQRIKHEIQGRTDLQVHHVTNSTAR